MNVISLPGSSSVGSPQQTTAKPRVTAGRLAGLGLTLIALGPFLVIAIWGVLTVFGVIELVRHTSAGVTAVAGIVESRISPQVAKVESAFDRLAAPLSQLKDNVNGAMAAFDHVGSIQIAKGAWGDTPSVSIKMPPSDLKFGEIIIEVPHVGFDGVHMEKVSKPLVTIDDGALFNKSTPSVPIPPVPVTLSIEPVQRALTPFGPNGAIGKAIQATESRLNGAIADISNLRRPLLAVRDGIAGLLAPIEAAIAPVARALLVVVIALAAQALLCAAGIVFLVGRRPVEFTNALIMGGPFGLLGYCYRTLLQSAFSLAFGGGHVPPERQIEDLRARTASLQSEIAMLRADLFSPRSGAATN